MNRVYCTIVALIVSFAASASDTREIQDSLWRALARTTDPRDSITTLYHLYDVSERSIRGQVGMIIYDVASRLGDTAVQLDILRNNTNIYVSSDSTLAVYERLAESVPPSDDRDETLTFIAVNRLSYNYRMASVEKRQEMLKQLIGNYEKAKDDNLLLRIRRLYELCVCLGISDNGELYGEYMSKLGELIDKLPHNESHALRNMYLTQLAIIDSYNGNYASSIKADLELLDEIELLKRIYRDKKRVYRHYDVNEYLCYTRLLGNFPALKKKDIEDYYAKVREIAARDNDVARDLERTQRANIYYLMANKRYAEVLPLLKGQVKRNENRRFLRQYLQFLTEAAGAVGDSETQLYAAREYNRELEDYMRSQAAARYRELQILYDVNELKADKAKLQLEKKEAEHRMHHRLLVVSLVALGVLVVLIVVLGFMYAKARKLALNLELSKSHLQSEKNNLLETQQELIMARNQAERANRTQTQFIQNMRHEILSPLNAITGFSQLIVDSVPESMRKELDRYAGIISVNSELLRTLVSDVLDISQMESGEIKLSRQPVSLRELCGVCINNVAHRVKPGVKLEFVDSLDEDFMLLTDPVRVEQIILNFLTNAAKYTDSGFIRLTYEVDEARNEVDFSVTDTGIGIPEGKEEIIFERFEKLSRYEQGTGLGLHISRFVAQMLGGRVFVDKSYRSGARFVFTLPVD